MGLVESTLKTQVVKPLVRSDLSAPLPLFSVESALFVDGTFGFVITSVDIAKNTNISNYYIKSVHSPAENSFVFACTDDSVFTFTKDRNSDKVFCTIFRTNTRSTIVRSCIPNYEPIGNEEIDKIGTLFKQTAGAS